MNLILSDERKGYSRAVKDGMRALEARYAPLWIPTASVIQRLREFLEGPYGLRRGPGAASEPGGHSASQDNVASVLPDLAKFSNPCPGPRSESCLMSSRKEVVVLAQLVDELGAMKQGFGGDSLLGYTGAGTPFRSPPVNHRLRAAGTTKFTNSVSFPELDGVILSRCSRYGPRQGLLPQSRCHDRAGDRGKATNRSP